MKRIWTAVDVEDLARGKPGAAIVLQPGDLISPQARDIAAARGITLEEAGRAAAPGLGGDNLAVVPTGGEIDERLADEVSEVVELTLRDVTASVIAAHPSADAATVASETLAILGAGGQQIGSPAQAQPLPGHQFPKKGKGARPQYFDDPGMEAIVSTLVTVTSELWVLNERVQTLEKLLEDRKVLEKDAISKYQSSPEERSVRSKDASSFVARVLRVFYEWREEIVAGETRGTYHEVVRRAFSKVEEKVE